MTISEKCMPLINKMRHTDNWTPLHLAIDQGNRKMATFLIDCGANIDAVSNDAWTPLMIAARKMDHKIVKMLVSYGASKQFVKKRRTWGLWNCII